jgi:RNA-binding protein
MVKFRAATPTHQLKGWRECLNATAQVQFATAGQHMALSSQQKRYLRGLTHSIHPVVTVADKGLSDTVLAEIEVALKHHELIKIRMRAERELRKHWIDEISKLCKAEPVHVIGQVASFYRRNSKKPVIALPNEKSSRSV